MRAALRSAGSPSPGATAPRGRHRFVQDGEVPVVVVNQRVRGPEEGRAAAAEAERLLGRERDLRMAAEKALQQAEETIRQLRTRLAHAEMAREEVAREEVAREEVAREEAALQETLREEAAAAPVAGAVPMADPAPVAGPVQEDGVDGPSPAPRTRRAKRTSEAAADEGAVEWWVPGWRERLRSA